MFIPSQKIRVPHNQVWTLNVPRSNKVRMIEDQDNCWSIFVEQSTCAAVSHLGQKSQSALMKTVWRIAFIVGITLTALSTYYSTRSFLNASGSSEMIPDLSDLTKIKHPKYHICSSNNFNLTILAEMGFVDNDIVSYLTLVMSIYVVSPAFLENIEHQRQLEKKYNDILLKNGIKDISEIINRALYRCEDIIAGCITPGFYIESADCCAKFFPTGSFPSTTGACVSTIGAPDFYQTVPSMSFGFVVFVKDLRDSYRSLDNSIVSPILANQKGVSFSVADQWTHPTVAMFQQKYYTRIGLWTSLALSKTTVNDEEIMKSILVRKTCAARNEPDFYRHLVPGFVNYTEANCNYAYRQNRVTSTVGCYIITLPYEGNLPPCSPHQLLKLASVVLGGTKIFDDPIFTQIPECVSECWKETYSFKASHADLEMAPNFKFGNWTISPNQSHLAALNFYYTSFTHTMLINHYPTLPQWLGVLGGNLGLFLGASMITVIELIVLFFTCCISVRRFFRKAEDRQLNKII